MNSEISRQREQARNTGWQLDECGSGEVSNSINLFRRDRNSSFKLFELPGRNGLDLTLSAYYGSSIHSEGETWKRGTPAGVLGVGWRIPFDAIVAGGQITGSKQDTSFYLLASGQMTRLRCVQVTDSVMQFQLRAFPLWQIEYFLEDQTWVIAKADGSRCTYGAIVDDDGKFSENAMQWGVKWGKHLQGGKRSHVQRYPSAWNLVQIESKQGDRLCFEYESTMVPVGATGVNVTLSCRLKRVTDVFGRQVSFSYQEKAASELQFPYVMPYSDEVSIYHLQYETHYLACLEARNSLGQHIFSTHFAYDFYEVPLDLDPGQPDDTYKKRYLKRVYQTIADNEPFFALEFAYAFDPTETNLELKHIIHKDDVFSHLLK